MIFGKLFVIVLSTYVIIIVLMLLILLVHKRKNFAEYYFNKHFRSVRNELYTNDC